MKKLTYFLVAFLMFLPMNAQQKSDNHKPAWMAGDLPTKTNSTYEFHQVSGEGKTLTEARHDATLVLLNNIMREHGVTIGGTQQEKIIAEETQNGYSESSLHNYDYHFTYEDHQFSFRAVDEYWENNNGTFRCYMLYEVAINPNKVIYEPVEYTTNYGTSAFFRSLIVPGWGQLHKKQKAKGIAILGTTIVGAVGIVVCQNQYSSYHNKALKNTDNNLRRSYQNKSNSWGNIRNGFIVGTSALYVYNLIDVLTSKGAKKYKKNNLSFKPTSGLEYDCGITIALNF